MILITLFLSDVNTRRKNFCPLVVCTFPFGEKLINLKLVVMYRLSFSKDRGMIEFPCTYVRLKCS